MNRERSQDDDVYDGYANYRESLRPPRAGVRFRNFVRGILSFLVGITVGWVLHRIIAPDVGMLIILTAPFAFVIGLVGMAVCYTWLVGKEPKESRPWGAGDAVATAIVVFGFVIPLSMQRAEEQRRQQARQEAQEVEHREWRESAAQRRADAFARMQRAGHSAPPGVVPPGLEVRDQGHSVTLTWKGEHRELIALSRVRADPLSPGGWKGCAMWTSGEQTQGRRHNHYLAPGATQTFHLYPECSEEFSSAPLEFRVGDPTIDGPVGSRAWWSQSAISSPDGRERETSRYRAATPAPTVTQHRASRPGASVEAVEPREAERPAPAGIDDVIRCRDASGAIQYTQTQCPPGTTLVEPVAR